MNVEMVMTHQQVIGFTVFKMNKIRIKEDMTLYGRDKDKNYAFVNVGSIGSWTRGHKSIWLNGKLYTLTQVEV